MHIVFAASECVPYAKTGGLGDVIGALPKALVKAGQQVTVYLPLYRNVYEYMVSHSESGTWTPPVKLQSITIPFDSFNRFAAVLDGGKMDGVQFYFIRSHEYFDRPGIYGNGHGEFPDNAERFGFFCRAVLEAAKFLGVPDLFHVHDWPTSLVPVLLRTTYASDPLLGKVPSVCTIHNIGYQGTFPNNTMARLLLPWDLFTMDRLEYFDKVNFLKGGLVYADWITTVSRRYAEEIQTPEYGFGLDTIVRRRRRNLTGILNGVDYTRWDPAHDSFIAANYSSEDLSGKAKCRQDLLRLFGSESLPPHVPIVAIISRMAAQKGFDLLSGLGDQLAAEDMALVVLGTGDTVYETFFRGLAERFPGRFLVKIGYDNAFAHKIEAGADMVLMPSHYEPCGLNQIYSLRYGTVPIVRATGGLDDTVVQCNPSRGTGTGFKFHEYTPGALMECLETAIAAFKKGDNWRKIMYNGMLEDFSWDKAVPHYLAVFENVLRRTKTR